MIHHQWSLICGQYINDRRTGAASLIDIYDSVRIQKIDEDEDGDPVYKPLLFSLVSDWRADSREDVGSARIRVFQDGRETAVSESTTLEFNSRGRTRTVAQFAIIDPDPGSIEYAVELKPDGDFSEVTRVTLEIRPAKVAESASEANQPIT